MVGPRDRATKGRARTTKTLAWRPADEAVLRTLRAQVAATFGWSGPSATPWPRRSGWRSATRRPSPRRARRRDEWIMPPLRVLPSILAGAGAAGARPF